MSLFGLDAVAAVLVIPLTAGVLLAFIGNYRLSARLNVLASLLTFAVALTLFGERPVPGKYLFVDDLNIVFIVLNTLVGLTTSIFSLSYIAHELSSHKLTPLQLRFYHAMYQLMMFGMNLALVSNSIGLMWVAVELATLTTVMMVGIYRTHEALEAAWKYFILGSVGIALALFGTILVYMAARPVVGEGVDAMVWTILIVKVAGFDPGLLNLAFVFLLLGYGTKVGLAPLHAWLPDAHAEGPTPVSAVLSGLLLNVALYAVLRFKMLLAASPETIPPGPLMITMGLTSVIFAAFMLYRRRDIKRLFAYSSIEHMGIITFAFGMGGVVANFAGLLHMVMHSLTKSAIFFAVGHISQVKGTQKIADIGGLTESHPVLGWGLVMGVAAIAGLPPFGIFMSEFLVVSSTFSRSPWLAVPLVFGLLIGFGALLLRLNTLAFGEPRGSLQPVEASYVPLFLHLALVFAAGIYLPPPLVAWFQHVAALLGMTRIASLLEWVATAVPAAGQQPWPRALVDSDGWEFAIGQLVSARWALLGLWADADAVHMALSEEAASSAAVISIALVKSEFPSVGARHAPAQRLERTIFDLFGWRATGASDLRPWLDHGRFGVQHPLSAATPAAGAPAPYTFLPAEGESLHQIPVGPVHAGIIEPGHFRFHAHGETVVRLEERLGYVHKGVESLMTGASLTRACQLAARVSGDSTVAYAYAFARASEAALSTSAPSRAVWLRALLAEIERVANHLGDIGAICNDASFALMHTHCGILREQVLRASEIAFGHRLLRDLIVPGGVARDLDAAGQSALRGLVADLREALPALTRLYDNTASLQDRTVGTGVLKPELAWQFACGGYVGRASGRTFDARRHLPYPPYDQLAFDVPTLDAGDVDARVWIRIHELGQSFSLLDQLLDALPAGAIRVELPLRAGEGIAVIEGFRGDILAWLRLDAAGAVARCHLRDPSWFQWPLLEAAIEGNIVADFPLCNKSFNCSYSGHDV